MLTIHLSEFQEALEVQYKVEYDCQCFWRFWLGGAAFTCATGQRGRTPFCASCTVCLTNSLQPEHFVPEPFTSQEGIMDVDHVLFMDILSDRIKTPLSNVCPSQFLFFMREHKRTHSFAHALKTNPVSWNKKAARWAEGCTKFMHFSSIHCDRAWLLMKAGLRFTHWPHPGWSVCLADITLICLLRTQNKMSGVAWRSMPGHLLDLLNTGSSQKNVLCKWFRGHRNVLKGEFGEISPICRLGSSQTVLTGGKQDLWFPQDKIQRKCVDLLLRLKGPQLDGTRKVLSHTFTTGRQSALNSH